MTIPETITCFSCDATADSIAEANAAGWRDIQKDLGGLSWNYLGTCPECAAIEAAEEDEAHEEAAQREAEVKKVRCARCGLHIDEDRAELCMECETELCHRCFMRYSGLCPDCEDDNE